MLTPILLFALGLVLLIKGGDWFVDSATGIARRFHLPEILIGATVVSIGTTLPEVMVSAQGAIAGSGSMAYGNAVGSIICNTALIAALTIAIKPGKAERKSMIVPVCFFFGAAAFYMTVAYATGCFSRPVGIILLSIFVIYMIVTVLQMKKNPTLAVTAGEEEEAESSLPDEEYARLTVTKKLLVHILGKRKSVAREIILLGVGAAVIALGASLLVDNGTIIAHRVGVPESVIALTFVALGTSLPELVTAIASIAKGHGSLSLGNIIGANIFNLVLVSGVAVTISPFPCRTLAGFSDTTLRSSWNCR